MSRFLVTGGAGYIGSHTCKRLARAGHEVVVFDNLFRGYRDFVKWGPLVEGDLRDTALLRETLRWTRPDAVIHFAALAYVGESVVDPARYYDNNVGGTLSLLQAMRDAGVARLIVSSTCAVYGQPERMPIAETAETRPANPYGFSKLAMEQMCRDFERAHGLRFVALRYFNACGCDPDGEIGERHDPEPHLIPRALMAAAGKIPSLDIFGNDYLTADGTCIRDYVHVVDLCSAHLLALRKLVMTGTSSQYNLGNGTGFSVQEVIRAAERVTGSTVKVVEGERRAGDPAVLVADSTLARAELGWQPQYADLEQIIAHAWQWEYATSQISLMVSQVGAAR